jgi:GNAT superfamily N-acetyltransferase
VRSSSWAVKLRGGRGACHEHAAVPGESILGRVSLAAIAIRPAMPADLLAVKTCVEAAYTPYIAAIGVRPRPLDDDYAARIARGQVWLAVTEAGDTVGALVLVVEPDHVLIENYAVVPAWQDRGISKRFDVIAHRVARSRGLTRLRLYTHAKMSRNAAIYRKRGWVEVDCRTEHGFDRVFFERDLLPDEGWE